MTKLFATLGLMISIGNLAFADGKVAECTRLWQLEKELGCPAMPQDLQPPMSQATPRPEHFLANKDFGPSKCVPSDMIDDQKDILEKKCESWVTKQKGHLNENAKTKGEQGFRTGSCNSTCSPCPNNESLQRCSTHGEVHYVEK